MEVGSMRYLGVPILSSIPLASCCCGRGTLCSAAAAAAAALPLHLGTTMVSTDKPTYNLPVGKY